jgi:hypothetical protein
MMSTIPYMCVEVLTCDTVLPNIATVTLERLQYMPTLIQHERT